MWFSIIFHCSYVVVAEEPRNRQSWLVIELSSRPATSGCEGRKANHPLTQQCVHVLNHIQRSWDEFPTKNPVEVPFVASICKRFFRKKTQQSQRRGQRKSKKQTSSLGQFQGRILRDPTTGCLVGISIVEIVTWYVVHDISVSINGRSHSLPSRSHSSISHHTGKRVHHRLKKPNGKRICWYVSFLEGILLQISYVVQRIRHRHGVLGTRGSQDCGFGEIQDCLLSSWGRWCGKPKQAAALQLQDGEDHGDVCWALNRCTLPKFNVAPEKWWLEDYSPFRMVYFQGLC